MYKVVTMMVKVKASNLYALLSIVLIVGLAALTWQVMLLRSDVELIKSQPGIQQGIKLQSILNNLQGLNETQGYPLLVSLEELTPQQIDQLKQEQPVIYNALPDKTLYRIILANEDQT